MYHVTRYITSSGGFLRIICITKFRLSGKNFEQNVKQQNNVLRKVAQKHHKEKTKSWQEDTYSQTTDTYSSNGRQHGQTISVNRLELLLPNEIPIS